MISKNHQVHEDVLFFKLVVLVEFVILVRLFDFVELFQCFALVK